MTILYTYKGNPPPKPEDYYLENLSVEQLESLELAHEGEVQWMITNRIKELKNELEKK